MRKNLDENGAVTGNMERAIFAYNCSQEDVSEVMMQLLAFEGQSRLNLNAVLRPGNTHSSTDATDFILDKFSEKVKGKIAYKEPKKTGWTIEKDTAGHGGREIGNLKIKMERW